MPEVSFYTALSESSPDDAARAEAEESAQLAKDWANKLPDEVDGSEFSSKYYANLAQADAIVADAAQQASSLSVTESAAFASEASAAKDESIIAEQAAEQSALDAAQSALDAGRRIAIRNVDGDETLLASDVGGGLQFTGATSQILTVEAGTLVVGDQLVVIQSFTGDVTITAGENMTIVNALDEFKTRAQYSIIALLCLSSNTVLMTGDTA